MLVTDKIFLTYRQVVQDAGKKHGIRPSLIAAIIAQESAGKKWAMREERAFYDRYVITTQNSPNLFFDREMTRATELRLRSFSFGLMQVMGLVAREHGYRDSFIILLLEPSINLDIGCKIFLQKLRASGGDEERAVLLYNGGADKTYPEKIYRWEKEFTSRSYFTEDKAKGTSRAR